MTSSPIYRLRSVQADLDRLAENPAGRIGSWSVVLRLLAGRLRGALDELAGDPRLEPPPDGDDAATAALLLLARRLAQGDAALRERVLRLVLPPRSAAALLTSCGSCDAVEEARVEPRGEWSCRSCSAGGRA